MFFPVSKGFYCWQAGNPSTGAWIIYLACYYFKWPGWINLVLHSSGIQWEQKADLEMWCSRIFLHLYCGNVWAKVWDGKCRRWLMYGRDSRESRRLGTCPLGIKYKSFIKNLILSYKGYYIKPNQSYLMSLILNFNKLN